MRLCRAASPPSSYSFAKFDPNHPGRVGAVGSDGALLCVALAAVRGHWTPTIRAAAPRQVHLWKCCRGGGLRAPVFRVPHAAAGQEGAACITPPPPPPVTRHGVPSRSCRSLPDASRSRGWTLRSCRCGRGMSYCSTPRPTRCDTAGRRGWGVVLTDPPPDAACRTDPSHTLAAPTSDPVGVPRRLAGVPAAHAHLPCA